MNWPPYVAYRYDVTRDLAVTSFPITCTTKRLIGPQPPPATAPPPDYDLVM